MRARVYQDGQHGWRIVWQASRYADTEAEARKLAELPVPPPPRTRRRVKPAFAAMLRELHDGGISCGLIAQALDQADVPTVRGGKRWYPATVRSIIDYEKRHDADTVEAPALAIVLQLEHEPRFMTTARDEDLARLRDWLTADPRAAELVAHAAQLIDGE